MYLIHDIARVYRRLTDEQAGRIRAFVTTARELDVRQVQEALASASDVSESQLVVDYSIDSTLIGGIVARVGDKLFDASIRSQVEHLKAELT